MLDLDHGVLTNKCLSLFNTVRDFYAISRIVSKIRVIEGQSLSGDINPVIFFQTDIKRTAKSHKLLFPISELNVLFQSKKKKAK